MQSMVIISEDTFTYTSPETVLHVSSNLIDSCDQGDIYDESNCG